MACAICDDTGWKTIEVDGVSRVTRCDCLRESAAARLLSEARIPRRYRHCDLANYTAYNEKLTKALQHATRLAEGFPVVDRGLLLLAHVFEQVLQFGGLLTGQPAFTLPVFPLGRRLPGFALVGNGQKFITGHWNTGKSLYHCRQ